jgi:hypothetical protein
VYLLLKALKLKFYLTSIISIDSAVILSTIFETRIISWCKKLLLVKVISFSAIESYP